MGVIRSSVLMSTALTLLLLRSASGSVNFSFDYVIVGGGTGGLVVANRLSENPNVTVAVVEAGTFPEDVHGNWTQVPFYQSKFVSIKDPMMWDFTTEPQTVRIFHSVEPSHVTEEMKSRGWVISVSRITAQRLSAVAATSTLWHTLTPVKVLISYGLIPSATNPTPTTTCWNFITKP